MVSFFAVLMIAGVLAPLLCLVYVRPSGIGDWMLISGAALAVVGFAVIAGPWVFLSLHARPAALLAFAGIAAVSYRRMARTSPGHGSPRVRVRMITSAGVLLAFASLTATALLGHRAPAGAADVRIPFRTGTFAVLQGGGSAILNPFHCTAARDRFALDLVRVNAIGNRARGLAPASLSAYESFGVSVHSPCEAVVERAVDGLPDNPPGNADSRHPEGNHVVLHCGTFRLLLAHLRQGSVALRAGEYVRAGDQIGEVGNSGNTLEPHLHVSAVTGEPAAGHPGRAMALTFGGRFLALNDTVRLRTP